ncbi:MAG: S8 family peptidase [Candidatus Heimdallarchaeota archaeon]|nr:S8 family peptidase [Candidatus Heimdallarchaeota archaeon]
MNNKKFLSLMTISLFVISSLAIAVTVSAEPMAYITVGRPGSGGGTTPQTIPWGISRVNGDTAQTTVDESGVNVAILDTGIDVTHEDLQGVFVWGYSFYLKNREISGAECTIADPSPCNDGHGHGTHVTGTVAAQNNEVGVLGVAPDVDIYTIKVLSDRGSGTYSAISNGIIIATNGPDGLLGTSDDANVISMSLGGSSGTAELEAAINYALDNGVVIVAATGNDGADSPSYPAAYPGVMKIGAIDSDNVIASFSNRGEDVFAPGVDVLSTTPGNSYASWAGTSMATPHAAGVVALAWASHPTYTNQQIFNLVVGTTDSYDVVDASQVV